MIHIHTRQHIDKELPEPHCSEVIAFEPLELLIYCELPQQFSQNLSLCSFLGSHLEHVRNQGKEDLNKHLGVGKLVLIVVLVDKSAQFEKLDTLDVESEGCANILEFKLIALCGLVKCVLFFHRFCIHEIPELCKL